MSKDRVPKVGDFNAAAHFFSDSHLFLKRNREGHRHLVTLEETRAQDIYFNGDTTDFERIRKQLKKLGLTLEQFPTRFSDVVTLLVNHQVLDEHRAEIHMRMYDVMMNKVSDGRSVTMIQGNHDDGLVLLAGETVQGINIVNNTRYQGSREGLAYVTHGQYFQKAFLKSYSGALFTACATILDGGLAADDVIATTLGPIFKRLQGAHFFADTLKKIGKSDIKQFRKHAVHKAHEEGAQIVICGHIHSADDDRPMIDDRFVKIPEHEDLERIRYLNSGDGVTHGTSLVHTMDDQWIQIVDTDSQTKAATKKKMLDTINPYLGMRQYSEAFLQTLWESQLKLWRGEKEVVARLEELKAGSVPEKLALAVA